MEFVPSSISMPKLLISVRDIAETQLALSAGCDILDVKEPTQGSLGMADSVMIGGIGNFVRSQATTVTTPVSAALGEMQDWVNQPAIPQLPADLNFVKLGLSGVLKEPDWRDAWMRIRQRFDESAGQPFHWIAVAYADWERANSPPPMEVIEAAAATQCAGVLFDTFIKDGSTLLDWISPVELERHGKAVHRQPLQFAIAGGLNIDSLSRINSVCPDIIAIRSAACRNGERSQAISVTAIKCFRMAMQSTFSGLPEGRKGPPKLTEKTQPKTIP